MRSVRTTARFLAGALLATAFAVALPGGAQARDGVFIQVGHRDGARVIFKGGAHHGHGHGFHRHRDHGLAHRRYAYGHRHGHGYGHRYRHGSFGGAHWPGHTYAAFGWPWGHRHHGHHRHHRGCDHDD
jgi:hypothetical protein